jgi:hypothetical protein
MAMVGETHGGKLTYMRPDGSMYVRSGRGQADVAIVFGLSDIFETPVALDGGEWVKKKTEELKAKIEAEKKAAHDKEKESK